MKHPHIPVLLDQTVAILNPSAGQSYLDGTAGYGGHAAEIIQRLTPADRVILIDRDPDAVAALAERFGKRVEIITESFFDAAKRLADEETQVDIILLDLGVSSPQFDNAERGFSFKADAPLDMRMDQVQRLSAHTVVNKYRQDQLERIIRDYGEEPKARAVARAIVAARPIESTTQLARVVRTAALQPKDIDSATKTFQAIRIEVNGELQQLEEALPILSSILAPSGRIAVISFHSLEDRIVKEYFNSEARDCLCPPKQPICTCNHTATLRKLLTKPVTATAEQLSTNPRARSAKLRAAEKINKNKRR